MGVHGFGVAAVNCLACDDAVVGVVGWIRNAENENRRLILRPEKATQQICVFKVLSIVDTHPCELTVSFTPQLVTVILFRVTH